jgi:RNA polymerase sigma factor FliA
MDQRNQEMPDANEWLWKAYWSNPSPGLREQLILAYAPLVKKVVGRMGLRPDGPIEWGDLVNYGIIGLIDAVERYEPERGATFSTFASTRIRGAVLDALRQMDPLGRLARRRVRVAQETIAQLTAELGRLPEDREVAEAMDLSVEQYDQVLQDASLVVLSLEHPLQVSGEGQPLNLFDTLEDEQAADQLNQVEEEELRNRLMHLLSLLPRREQILLSLYYYEGLTMREIAKVMDISQTRVCQLHARTMLNLRAVLNPVSPHEDSGEEGNVPERPLPSGDRPFVQQSLRRQGKGYNVLPSLTGMSADSKPAEL